jgi:hypothetical protein
MLFNLIPQHAEEVQLQFELYKKIKKLKLQLGSIRG